MTVENREINAAENPLVDTTDDGDVKGVKLVHGEAGNSDLTGIAGRPLVVSGDELHLLNAQLSEIIVLLNMIVSGAK